MAINVFRTVTANLTTSGNTIYTAPVGYSGIVLMAQISNVTGNAALATFSVDISGTLTELIKDFAVPGNDASSALTGKLVLESGKSVFASANVDATLKLVMSVLESEN